MSLPFEEFFPDFSNIGASQRRSSGLGRDALTRLLERRDNVIRLSAGALFVKVSSPGLKFSS